MDLSAPFALEMTGDLDKDGQLILSQTTFIRTEGDKNILELVKNGIETTNNAGYLQYLSMIFGKTIHLSVVQDDTNFSLTVLSELDSPRRAKTLETLFRLYISAESEKKQRPEATQNEKDALALLKGMSVTSEGKKLIIKVFIPKSVIHEIIQRKLTGSGRVPNMPNGIAENIRVL